MKRLILIHGRSQEDKDAIELKKTWLDALRKGLAVNGLTLPIDEERIRFPYYGDTLRDLCEGVPPEQAAKIVVRGAGASADDQQQIATLLRDYYTSLGITDAQIEAELKAVEPTNVRERGPQNWGWVEAIIRVIDQKVPGAGALIALVTNDVHQYLTKDTVRLRIEKGVKEAFDPADENIVVSHSLGTIVAYTLLRKLSKEGGWRVPTLVTVGSPLGIHSIQDSLGAILHPACVGEWFNASDPNDVVALNPLTPKYFNVNPAIIDKRDVKNWTPNKHGIIGYLDDKEVAKRIYDALVR